MLDSRQTTQMLLQVAARVIASRDLLTEMDKLGDGDHGVGMARGFEAVTEALRSADPESPADVLKTTGTTLMTSVGGAAGAVFGTLFRGGAAAIAEVPQLDGPAVARFLAGGLDAVKKRGGAAVGDKTVVDALEPAAHAAADIADVGAALTAASTAATAGMERTKEFPAKVGKMKTLGERTIGHPDPGAVSLHLILQAMSEYVDESLSHGPASSGLVI